MAKIDRDAAIAVIFHVCGAEVSRVLWAIDGAVDAWNRRTAGGADPKTDGEFLRKLP